MKALSIRAPWWWFILHQGKDIENRDWSTRFRGRVLVHASKWWNRTEVNMDWDDAEEMCGRAIEPASFTPLQQYGGCIVGSVEIVECVSFSTSDWFVGEYGFVLRDPVVFAQPLPFKGALGFFDVPDSLIEGLHVERDRSTAHLSEAVSVSNVSQPSGRSCEVLQRALPYSGLESAPSKTTQ